MLDIKRGLTLKGNSGTMFLDSAMWHRKPSGKTHFYVLMATEGSMMATTAVLVIWMMTRRYVVVTTGDEVTRRTMTG